MDNVLVQLNDNLSPLANYFEDPSVCPSIDIVQQVLKTCSLNMDEVQLVEEIIAEMRAAGNSPQYSGCVLYALGQLSAGYTAER